MQRHRTSGEQRGFTLIEVLIAVLVLAFGLMGLAGIQATGIKNNNSAYYRSIATQYATEIGDRMRANPGVDYSTVTAATHSSCKTVTGCTSTEMAENDLKEWTDGLSNSLPLGAFTIVQKTGAGTDVVFTVTVKWDDNRSGVNTSPEGTFAMDVRP